MPTAKTVLPGDAVTLAGFQFLLPLPPSLHPKQKKRCIRNQSASKREGGAQEVTAWGTVGVGYCGQFRNDKKSSPKWSDIC